MSDTFQLGFGPLRGDPHDRLRIGKKVAYGFDFVPQVLVLSGHTDIEVALYASNRQCKLEERSLEHAGGQRNWRVAMPDDPHHPDPALRHPVVKEGDYITLVLHFGPTTPESRINAVLFGTQVAKAAPAPDAA